MVIHPAKHWFETMLPELEPGEAEVFYHHPTLPLKVNHIGIIYFDNEEVILDGIRGQVYRIRKEDKKGYLSIGTRARVCYESYHGVPCPGKHFLHIDGNPANCGIENIIPTNPPSRTLDPIGYALYQEADKARKKFVARSLQYMKDKDEWVKSRGGDPEHYWQLFGEIPAWLETAYKKVKQN
jgi:hypothetical protein